MDNPDNFPVFHITFRPHDSSSAYSTAWSPELDPAWFSAALRTLADAVENGTLATLPGVSIFDTGPYQGRERRAVKEVNYPKLDVKLLKGNRQVIEMNGDLNALDTERVADTLRITADQIRFKIQHDTE